MVADCHYYRLSILTTKCWSKVYDELYYYNIKKMENCRRKNKFSIGEYNRTTKTPSFQGGQGNIIRITYYSVHLLQDKKYRACAAERRELRRTSARRQAPSQGQPPTNLDYFFPEIQQPTIHNKIPSTIASEEQEKTSRPDRLKLLIRRVCHIFNIQQSSWNKLKNIDCCIMY